MIMDYLLLLVDGSRRWVSILDRRRRGRGSRWRGVASHVGLQSPSPAVPARRSGVRRTGEGEDRKTNSSIWARNEGSQSHDALTLRNPNNNEGSSSNYIGLLGLKCT